MVHFHVLLAERVAIANNAALERKKRETRRIHKLKLYIK
jgi:hypothetical protein